MRDIRDACYRQWRLEMIYKVTAPVEEGPYYKKGSPERTTIAGDDIPGRRLVLEGKVLDTGGRPVAGAWLDFWQADSEGNYDNTGFTLRGYQYTDENGRYRLETIRPKEYLFRSPHVHAKLRANSSSPVLTTQLYFPGEARNETDPLFEAGTVMNLARMDNGEHATFDFVVEVR